MKAKSILVTLVISLFSTVVVAETLYEEFPSQINPGERYVFYSHGLIVEGDNETPIHPEYGKYAFPAIKRALFEIGGFNLMAGSYAFDLAGVEAATRDALFQTVSIAPGEPAFNGKYAKIRKLAILNPMLLLVLMRQAGTALA